MYPFLEKLERTSKGQGEVTPLRSGNPSSGEDELSLSLGLELTLSRCLAYSADLGVRSGVTTAAPYLVIRCSLCCLMTREELRRNNTYHAQ